MTSCVFLAHLILWDWYKKFEYLFGGTLYKIESSYNVLFRKLYLRILIVNLN
jgi:hypothetical protein